MEEKAGIKTIIGREVAEEILKGIYDDLSLDGELIEEDDEGKASKNKIISALMQKRLEYENKIFKQTLLEPITGKRDISFLTIKEPIGVQLRGMSEVKKKNDDVGKAMSILGEVTGFGLPMINKLGSRDIMLSVAVISLFL